MSIPRKSVLISGAGIAGPALAYWLVRAGYTPVVVERAPAFRTGGYIIDFWGIGYDIAERMGLIPALRQVGYINDRAVFVRANGRVRSSFGGDTLRRALDGRFLSIQRGELAGLIYETVRHDAEFIFGDEIASLSQDKRAVDVTLNSGAHRTFDLVIGADGLHSAVRKKMVPSRGEPERFLGYHAAVFIAKGYSARDESTYLSYAVPGRQVSRFALRDDHTGFLFVFATKEREPPRELSAQKQVLKEKFSVRPWVEWPEIERHLDTAQELYFDAVSQIELPKWSAGRVGLVGDAAYCPSLLAGEGSAFAIAGAYILAAELTRAECNHLHAFKEYERRFRPFILRKQKSARGFASSFTPATEFGLAVRDLVLHLAHIPVVARMLVRSMIADRFKLPEY